MEKMTLCIDISKCTGCRACQVACKNWNQLKAEKTHNSGSHENPPDLSSRTWNRVLFREKLTSNGRIDWIFINDRCRHCDYPPCMEAAEDVPGAVIRHDSGAVIFTKKTAALDYDDLLSFCPYDIPRVDEETRQIYKCNMCIDRVIHGLKPACVTTCPTGALSFGSRKQMLPLIEARIKTLGGDANIYPDLEHNTLWILPEDSKNYPLTQAPKAPQRYSAHQRGWYWIGATYAALLLTAGLVRFRDRVISPNKSNALGIEPNKRHDIKRG